MKYRNAIIIVLLIIIADQAMKFYIKTHFCNGDDVKIFGSWFRLHFIENEGMAYGLKIIDSPLGKLLLSSFRLIAVVFGFFLLKRLVTKQYTKGVIVCGALILAGALGNLLDSMFYGLIFTESPYSCFSGNYESLSSMMHAHNQTAVAHLCNFGAGYGKFLQGKVVDMLYVPMIDTIAPKWIPFIGGKNFVFFEPVFNIADAAISIGVITLLIIVYSKKTLISIPTAPSEPAIQQS